MQDHPHIRYHLEITGKVQGVGFRPLCYQLAKRYQLTGWVLNHGGGVSLEIQGTAIEDFIQALTRELPPLAEIQYLHSHTMPVNQKEQHFVIRESKTSLVTTTIPPDSSVCPDCLKELFDPNSRYYRYPFINCTHCGPRYTVTRHLPYDRCNTSMASFELCPACQLEYSDPDNRRFHAQATACGACGPRLSMPVNEIVQHILTGKILAIKSLGGFHLVCDARNPQAVQTLRDRKKRAAKPFAIMAANIASLKNRIYIDDDYARLIESPQRPIVLVPKIPDTDLTDAIAPGINSLGVVLPYTPLHYLIFNEFAGNPEGTRWLEQYVDLCLVVTSANPGGEPLVIDNLEARQSLAQIADVIIDYNRNIATRCDDSVMCITEKVPRFIRRARSFVPQAIKLPAQIPSVLAVGGHLKNTICVTRGDQAFLSQHIGNIENRATYDFFKETVNHLLETLQIEPVVITHDKHPDFLSTRFAQNYGIPAIAVQHHHAHLAAVAAEHNITQPFIGLALDGFGLGENNQSWGGELLLLKGAHYQRLGHLTPLKQPGGDSASREPWRMAAAIFARLGRSQEITPYFQQKDALFLQQMLEKNINCPETSSAGRLFDAAAGLLKIQSTCSYEGQAAMMLESLVTQPEVMQQGWIIHNNQIDFLPLLETLINCNPVNGANLFHGTLVAGLSVWLDQNARQQNINTIVLAGGCFLNQVLTTGLQHALVSKGFRVKLPQQAPVNDGGISLGQAWVAGLNSIESGFA